MVLTLLVVPERKPHERTPADLGFHDVRELSFRSRSGDVLLHGWLLPSDGDSAVVLIHGLHSHAWDCQTPDLARAYADAGFNVLLFDLRAHGASGGDHAGAGLLERGDVRAAVDLLLEEGIEPGRIGLHGVSYGAAVALLATARIPEIGAVIADSAFARASDVIGGEITRRTDLPAAISRILLPGVRLLAMAAYGIDLAEAAPVGAIGRIAPRPVLLIHGSEDSIIPYDHAERLKAAAGPGTALSSLEGSDHTQGVRMVPDCEEVAPTRGAYLRRSVEFFRRHLDGEGALSMVPARPARSGLPRGGDVCRVLAPAPARHGPGRSSAASRRTGRARSSRCAAGAAISLITRLTLSADRRAMA